MANRKKFYKLYSEDKDSKPPSYKPGTDVHVLMCYKIVNGMGFNTILGIDSVWYIVFILLNQWTAKIPNNG